MDEKLFYKALKDACVFVASKRDELCKLDTGIGDGDHGITVERGFSALAVLCDDFGKKPAVNGTITELFEAAGEAMMSSMGGAIGPVYGAFWSGAALAYPAGAKLCGESLAEAFSGGCQSVMTLGKVSPGDKTVVDAIFPCKEAMLQEKHGSVYEVLKAGANAAKEGVEATKDMVAKRGRARFMGEKSKGYIDAGAASFGFFIEALAENLK